MLIKLLDRLIEGVLPCCCLESLNMDNGELRSLYMWPSKNSLESLKETLLLLADEPLVALLLCSMLLMALFKRSKWLGLVVEYESEGLVRSLKENEEDE